MALVDEKDWHQVQGRSSYVWQFFERRRLSKASESGKSFSEHEHRCSVFYQNPDGTLQRCHKVKQTSDTSNLHAHLLKEHGISKDNFTSRLGLLSEDTAREILTGISGVGVAPLCKDSPQLQSKSSMLDRSFTSSDTMHACIASLAAKHALPLSIFESPAFDAVIRAAKKHKGTHLEPRMISTKVSDIAKWTEEAIHMRVNETEFVSLSLDRGSDPSTRNLLTFVAHMVEAHDVFFSGDPEPDWVVREIQLETYAIGDDAPEEEIAIYTTQIIRKYMLGERLVALVSDRIENTEKVLRCIRDSQIEPPGDDARLRMASVVPMSALRLAMQTCFSPVLQQERPTTLINNIFSLVDNCRRFNIHSKEIARLTELVGQAYLESSGVRIARLSVIVDLLDQFLRSHSQLLNLAASPSGKNLADFLPALADRRDLDEMASLLRLVRDRMAAFTTNPSVPFATLAHCAEALFSVSCLASEYSADKSEFVKHMARGIVQGVQTILWPGDPPTQAAGQINILAVAAGLHPLLKDGCIYQPAKDRAADWTRRTRDLLVAAIKQTDILWPRPAGPLGRPVSPQVKRHFVGREKDIAHVPFMHEAHQGAMLEPSLPPPPPPGSTYTELDEVDEYLELRNEEFATQGFSVVKFWAVMAHTHRFPRLARLARRILCVPASTMSLDRALASLKGGHINSIDPTDGQMVNALLLVSRNEIAAE